MAGAIIYTGSFSQETTHLKHMHSLHQKRTDSGTLDVSARSLKSARSCPHTTSVLTNPVQLHYSTSPHFLHLNIVLMHGMHALCLRTSHCEGKTRPTPEHPENRTRTTSIYGCSVALVPGTGMNVDAADRAELHVRVASVSDYATGVQN